MPKKKKAAKKKSSNILASLPRSEEAYLEMLIAHSEKYAVGNGPSLDSFFKNQAIRQRKQLEELRKKSG